MRSNSYPQYPANNGVGIAYNYIRFNNQPEGNWHMLTLQYQRLTRFGPVILKGNFVNKFDNKGAQVEIEAYPRLSPMFYLYVGAGYSDNDVVFHHKSKQCPAFQQHEFILPFQKCILKIF